MAPAEQVEVVVGLIHLHRDTGLPWRRGAVHLGNRRRGGGTGGGRGRQGFAYAESLDPEVVAEVLADALGQRHLRQP